LKNITINKILRIAIALMVILVFAVGCVSIGFCKGGGGGGARGAVRSTGTVKSAPKATTSSGAKSTTSTSFGSRVKSWFSQRASSGAAKTYSTPATPANNAYFSNGRYNGWTGIFWGYMLGRALTPHSTPVTATDAGTTSDGKYELAGDKQYTWDEPSVGDDLVAYGALILFVVLIFLIGRLIYKRIKRSFGSEHSVT